MNRFGISTHLFHESRLERAHLVDIAAHGFETIELVATRSHVDYTSDSTIATLKGWLADTRLELHSVHAPIVDEMRGGAWVGLYSLAAGEEARRKAAVEQARLALQMARTIPYRFLVVHVGLPSVERVPPNDNQPGAAKRSIEELAAMARDVGVQIALEVIPNSLSTPEALVHLLEEEMELENVGIGLDCGHAHLGGDVVDAVETISGLLLTTHVHDNGGKRDDHLVPFAGSIAWDPVIMSTQKVGYDGVLMFEVANTGDASDVLRRTVKARERLTSMFVTF